MVFFLKSESKNPYEVFSIHELDSNIKFSFFRTFRTQKIVRLAQNFLIACTSIASREKLQEFNHVLSS